MPAPSTTSVATIVASRTHANRSARCTSSVFSTSAGSHAQDAADSSGSSSRRDSAMSRRRVLVLLLAVILAAAIEVAASMAWPATVPRLALLPRPEMTTHEVECNTVTRYWNRDGLFWVSED